MTANGSVEYGHNAWFDNLEDTDFAADTDVNEDCDFVQYSSDLHLSEGSPCIDAGTPELSDPDGSVSDIGAFGGPGAEWEGETDTGDTGGDTGDTSDTGDGDDGDDVGVRAFCGCRSNNSAILILGLLPLLFRRQG